MKKLIAFTLVLVMILSLAACGGKNGTSAPPANSSTPPLSANKSPTPSSEVPTTSDNSEEQSGDKYLNTDMFPENWIGLWDCVDALQAPMSEGDIIELKDYKNRATITRTDGYKVDWVIYYNADSNLFCFHDSPSFSDTWDYEIVKQTETEIILEQINSKYNNGTEIVLVKRSGESDDVFPGTSDSTTTFGSSSDWRKFLKDYEEFVDAYVAVLKKYTANPLDFSILGDYMDMMTAAEEWSDEYDAMSDELDDPKELAEFIKEWTRIYAKMFSAFA